MGTLMLESILSLMNGGGIRTQRAWPGKAMPAVEETVAAVNLEAADLTTGITRMRVQIVSPFRLGGGTCEDTAMAAARVLKTAGFRCQVEKVEFDDRAGHFSAAILVSNARENCLNDFKIGAVAQKYVVSFTAQQELEQTDTDLSEAAWTVTLEQFFPLGASEDTDPSGTQFTLTNGSEIYHGCSWLSRKRVTEADGIRQIRTGTAMSRTQ